MIEDKSWLASIDLKLIELLQFAGFVLFGVIVKMIREMKKPTLKRVFAEIVMSFFVAFIVYAVLVQFFELNNYFVYASCSYAGSISSKFLDNMENAIEGLFKAIPEKFKLWKTSGKSKSSSKVPEDLNNEA
jgi:glucan phosphoethanolaminetransferase (alkaline phosphatase superfamily)